MALRAIDVFTPNDFPRYSYVNREGENLEADLAQALATPKAVVSLSGPSKSGKTVLIEKVVGLERLITVSGAQVADTNDLWNTVLDWMGVPDSEQIADGSSDTRGTSASGSIEGGLPLVTKATGSLGFQATRTTSASTTAVRQRSGLAQVEREIANSDFVVFIDDFHYIASDVQTGVARQVKAAAERGVRICLAAVPYRSDDAVRSNSELRGRTTHIDVGFWKTSELSEIAITGFKALSYDISQAAADRFALESCGSPQLMQQICLQACGESRIDTEKEANGPLNLSGIDFETDAYTRILQKSAAQTDYTSLVRDMHAGPKTRGTERKEFHFVDGSEGDVYRALLLALASDPPVSDLGYSELIRKVEAVCVGHSPGSGSVIQSAKHLSLMARRTHPEERILEWEDNAAGGILSIVDPYLLFYIRSSAKLADLGARA